jgi:hypothetical protein
MREALFILLVLLALAALTAYRYRNGIRMLLDFWRAMRTIREKARGPGPTLPDEPAKHGTLVFCAKCRKWIPEQSALKLGRSNFYCSAKCMEAGSRTKVG